MADSFFHDKTEHLPATYLGKNSQSISPPIVREKKDQGLPKEKTTRETDGLPTEGPRPREPGGLKGQERVTALYMGSKDLSESAKNQASLFQIQPGCHHNKRLSYKNLFHGCALLLCLYRARIYFFLSMR